MAYDISVELDGSARGVLDPVPYVELVQAVLAAEGVEDGSAVALLFADDELIWRLNREHRGVDAPTDVLSFPAQEGEPFPAGDASGARELGDILVSVQTARRQAIDAGLSLEMELRHLVLHGLLHLLGYDHEGDDEAEVMRAREEAILGVRIHEEGGHDGH